MHSRTVPDILISYNIHIKGVMSYCAMLQSVRCLLGRTLVSFKNKRIVFFAFTFLNCHQSVSVLQSFSVPSDSHVIDCITELIYTKKRPLQDPLCVVLSCDARITKQYLLANCLGNTKLLKSS